MLFSYAKNIGNQKPQSNFNMARALAFIPPRHKMQLTEIRCHNCSQRLCDATLVTGIVEIKCRRCGQKNYITGIHTDIKKVG